MKRKLLQLFGFFICSISALRRDFRIPEKQEKRVNRRDLQETVGFVEDFILINSATDQAIMRIQDGATINISSLNTARFNVQTTVSGDVQSIKFGYNDRPRFHVENGPTFAFCGHVGTNFFRCEVLDLGEHTIMATPYSEKGLSGEEGSPVHITFTIINENVPAAPTRSPTQTINCRIPKVSHYSTITINNL